ncbi:chromosomal replication initiator DnaA [Sphingomonas cannabina]|uniref:chromosomal replication initiator DnaA n=1 Tax=Sphingomonas cannabina TaxID=2899123 RepID=UPI001F18A8B1|nr:chromosomal replication initiator DnaA [Sphingomonas cannabina]UIJ43659.1 chromosomal replication initiator DnaA [Sphingomonas cannabina]
MTPDQFDLPLPKPAVNREDEFLVSESNARAVHAIEHWGTWPVMAALLVGPRKSGRSLLARMFVAKTGGTMIDDAERVSETEIFHAWNRAQAERRPLLIVADAAPPEWAVRLPDLRSRLAASPVLRLGPPDDDLMPELLRYLFDRRELDARPDLIAWLVRRVERSHLAVLRVVDRIEETADHRRTRKLSIPMVRAALSEAGLVPEKAASQPTELL